MAQHDLAPYGDLVRAEPEGHGLHGECLVDPDGQVQRADHDVVGRTGARAREAQHAGETTRAPGGIGARTGRPERVGRDPVGAGATAPAGRRRVRQNRTLMNAPTSWKPTLR
ncbi:hypothetical protein GCM10010515_65180 [Streptomyces fructofermentans]|uniref:Uncharacterized protein n=1 Tax=Streptomyces fructofermentans TaxID=152141 RepID=A0A918NR30_9ACTN|nr:hypothetical protein GCM10010515_65180 [Streptomyces fructofermentans]